MQNLLQSIEIITENIKNSFMKIDINTFTKDYNNKNIIVIGDIILDTYVLGNVNRISQEAPVPIVSMQKKDFKPGGAANVAINLSNLGASVTLVGVSGFDSNHIKLIETLNNYKNIKTRIIQCDDRPTTVKTRIIADNRQLVRLDDEIIKPVENEIENKITDICKSICPNADGIIIQDYNKGLLTKNIISYIMSYSIKKNKSIYVDPKHDNYQLYKGARLFKPNLKEFNSITKNMDFGSLPESGFRFKELMDCELLLLTLGSKGMTLYDDRNCKTIATKARKVYDVSGAGDTVIATFAINDICGIDPIKSSYIANLAAGRVCEEVGVFPIDIESLKDIFFHHQNIE